MNEIKLSGSYYEMGVQLGQMLKNKLSLPEAAAEKLEWATNCESAMKKYTPGLLDELQGFAEAANLKTEQLNAILLYDCSNIQRYLDPMNYPNRCTIFVILGKHTESGYPIYARNYDWMLECEAYFLIYRPFPTNKLRSVVFTDHYVGGFGGINEAGLACGVTIVPYYSGEFKPGILTNMAVRWILDTFERTEEAVDFLETIPLCEGMHYYIADKESTIARVESSPVKVFTTYAEDELLVATNHFQSKEMQHLQNEISDDMAWTTFTRLEGIKNWYQSQEKPIAVTSVKSILRDHHYGVCDHNEAASAGTIWSWIASLGTNKVEISVGQPCKNDYNAYLVS